MKASTPFKWGSRRWSAFLAVVLSASSGARAEGAQNLASAGPGLSERLGQHVPLDISLRDDAGQPVPLRQLLGKPTFLSLNYFRCPGVCTPQLNAIAGMIDRLPKDARAGTDFQFLSVSFDPTDTPKLAASKHKNFLAQLKQPFPAEGWRFLTAERGEVKRLADAVGFSFKKEGDEYVHPAALIALAPDGQITRYLYGLSYLPADVQMAAIEAREGRSTPSIARFLRLCFATERDGRRTYETATRAAGGLTLLLVAGGVLLLLRKPAVPKKTRT